MSAGNRSRLPRPPGQRRRCLTAPVIVEIRLKCRIATVLPIFVKIAVGKLTSARPRAMPRLNYILVRSLSRKSISAQPRSGENPEPGGAFPTSRSARANACPRGASRIECQPAEAPTFRNRILVRDGLQGQTRTAGSASAAQPWEVVRAALASASRPAGTVWDRAEVPNQVLPNELRRRPLRKRGLPCAHKRFLAPVG